jgi:hypothetical protein
MSISKILARTVILFAFCIVLTIGVLFEGGLRLSSKLGDYLERLDNKLRKGSVKKKKEKTEVIPT